MLQMPIVDCECRIQNISGKKMGEKISEIMRNKNFKNLTNSYP